MAAAALMARASAQTADSADEDAAPSAVGADSVDEVVVRGHRMDEIEFDLHDYIRDFIGHVVRLPPGGGYARWHHRVCVGVDNLEAKAAQYLVDRISLLAADLGLEPGEPGCNPDVMIIFTVDAKSTASYLVENQPRIFRPVNAVCCMQLGFDALQAFVASDKAVRWWHVSMPVDARTGARAIRLPQDDSYPVISVAGPSRIHSGIRDDLFRVIVIVDSTKLTGTTWQEMGDYLAVVSLAQIDPEADPTEFDSILNLFTNPAAYTGLTDWDRSYMRALYAFDQERTQAHQRNSVVDEMARQDLADDD